MSSSLRDQLLKAGLVTEKQVRQAETQQRQQPRPEKSKRKSQAAVPQAPASATQQAQAAKLARDQELNRKQQEQAAAKARTAEIRQLIAQHRVARVESDEAYNFVAEGKVRRIFLDAAQRDQVMRGTLAIVRYDGRFELLPPDAAARIRERIPRAVVHWNDRSAQPASASDAPAPDDPYKDFVVPDDLMW
jgi:uncharacterized protein YaiL (DUF2058 family)